MPQKNLQNKENISLPVFIDVRYYESVTMEMGLWTCFPAGYHMVPDAGTLSDISGRADILLPGQLHVAAGNRRHLCISPVFLFRQTGADEYRSETGTGR